MRRLSLILTIILGWLFMRYGKTSHFLAVGLGTGTLAFIAWYVWPKEVRQLLRQAADSYRSIWGELAGNDPTCPDCGKKGSITMQGPVGIPDVGQCRYKQYCSCPSGHIWTTEQVVRSAAQTN